MSEKEVDDRDIEFFEEVMDRIGREERRRGGPRLSQDAVEIIRDLKRVSEQLGETMAKIVSVIEGKQFGDRTDGLLFRVARIERRLAIEITMVTMVAARVAWVELYPIAARIMGWH